jgi:pimeloyl-ACP methyl ester carboxylesterase
MHYCLATTMTDFHPDFPMVSTAPDRWSRLGFQFEVARIAATIQATRLSNVTIVTHDSGCQVGWILAYKFPTLVGRIVALTIGNSKGSTPFGAGTPDWMLSYQSHNVHAFDIKNTTPGGGPAGETATWEKCWEYWVAVAWLSAILLQRLCGAWCRVQSVHVLVAGADLPWYEP